MHIETHWELQRRNLWIGLLASVIALSPPDAFAAATAQTKTICGFTVYLGVVPAEIIKGHRTSHPEAGMHGGAPRDAHKHHIMVAVFDAASGARVTDARVLARVAPTWLGGSSKDRETMTIVNGVRRQEPLWLASRLEPLHLSLSSSAASLYRLVLCRTSGRTAR